MRGVGEDVSLFSGDRTVDSVSWFLIGGPCLYRTRTDKARVPVNGQNGA